MTVYRSGTTAAGVARLNLLSGRSATECKRALQATGGDVIAALKLFNVNHQKDTEMPSANYSLSIQADSGYRSTEEGRCTVNQYREATRALAGTVPYAPLTLDELRALTCMRAGASWPDDLLAELGAVLALYENLRQHGNRPVDPAAAHLENPLRINPWTGLPRDPRDIESDPQGQLIVADGAVLEAAR